jgi:AcrR family transcriptional regulator
MNKIIKYSYIHERGFHKMARGFSEQELTEIRKQLIDEARHQYRTRGFKSGIKDLTDAIGIAPGSFYKFFTSKEELIFTILEE